MTRRDTLQCVHEPFGDAYYYGPEFMSERFKDDEAYRQASGLADKTYANILESIKEDGDKEVRLSSTNFCATTITTTTTATTTTTTDLDPFALPQVRK